MGLAISSGSAMRLSRVAPALRSSSSWLILAFARGVAVNPGITHVTLTLCAQYSPANVLVRLLIADLRGPYSVLLPAEGHLAARELTFTIEPPFSFIYRNPAWHPNTTDLKQTPVMKSISPSSYSSPFLKPVAPTLLTQTSILPKCRYTCSAKS